MSFCDLVYQGFLLRIILFSAYLYWRCNLSLYSISTERNKINGFDLECFQCSLWSSRCKIRFYCLVPPTYPTASFYGIKLAAFMGFEPSQLFRRGHITVHWIARRMQSRLVSQIFFTDFFSSCGQCTYKSKQMRFLQLWSSFLVLMRPGVGWAGKNWFEISLFWLKIIFQFCIFSSWYLVYVYEYIFKYTQCNTQSV